MDDSEKFMNWQIEECIECLERAAREVGDAHSQIMEARGRGPTPNAYRSTNSYRAIEIIRQLQNEIKELQVHKE